MDDKLSFDENSHRYTLAGKGFGPPLVIPSVSQVISRAGLYGYAKNDKMVGLMNKGVHLHKVTVLIDEKMVASTDLDEEDAGYGVSYESFVKDFSFIPEYIERRMYHPKFLYAGTPDRIGTIEVTGEISRVLIDIKTGKPHPATNLQLAAYREMANAWGLIVENYGVPIGGCYALYIQADGDYKFIPMADFYDNWLTFQSALRIARWKEKNSIG